MRGNRDDRRAGSAPDATVAAATYHTEFDGDEPVTMAVVRAVSAITGIEPAVLTPLGECVETDALEALFAAPGGMAGQSFRFRYAGCTVTVRGDGSISLTAPAYD